jgi:hypothetical protein
MLSHRTHLLSVTCTACAVPIDGGEEDYILSHAQAEVDEALAETVPLEYDLNQAPAAAGFAFASSAGAETTSGIGGLSPGCVVAPPAWDTQGATDSALLPPAAEAEGEGAGAAPAATGFSFTV